MKQTVLFSIIFFSSQLLSSPITIWTSNENIKQAIELSTAGFEKEYHYKIKVNVLNKDLTTQFKTAALTSKGPDILVWAHDVVGELAESGLIEPLNVSPQFKNKFFKVAIDAFTYKGKLYGYPYDLEAVALIYNKNFLPTPPKSLEDLLNKAKKINKKGQYGFLYDLKNFFFSFPILSAGGGYIFKNINGQLNTKDLGLNNSGAIAGGEFIKRLVDEKIIPTSTDRSIAFEKMKQGKLAATIDGPWSLKDLRRSKIPYAIMPIPSLNGKMPRPFVGTHGFIIRRSSKNKEVAKELIENYLVSKKGILTLYKLDPRGPSRLDTINEISAKDPDLKNFLESASRGVPMPNIPEMGAVWGAMGSALNFITTGQQTPKQALNKAVIQIKQSLNK